VPAGRVSGRFALVCFLGAVGVALDLDDLGMMHEAIDDGDDAGGVGEHRVPFGKDAVGGHDRGLGFVAPVHDLEQQVGVAVGIGEVADLVDEQHLRAGVVVDAPAQSALAVLRGEVAEHGGCIGHQRGVPAQQALVQQVLCDRRLADAVAPDEYDVGGLFHEAERHQVRDGCAIADTGPLPVEVGDGLEGAEPGVAQPALQTAITSFALLPINESGDEIDVAGDGFVPVGDETVEVQLRGALAQRGLRIGRWVEVHGPVSVGSMGAGVSPRRS